MQRSERTALVNQAVTLLLLINNTSRSTGLCKVRREGLPNVLLSHTDIPLVLKDGNIYAQLDEPNVTLTLSFWRLSVYKIVVRSIIVPISQEYKQILDHIGHYLGVYLDYTTMQIKRLEQPCLTSTNSPQRMLKPHRQ